MTYLLEWKDKLKLFYSKNDVYILPVVKFILAFVALNVVNQRMGYMVKLDSTPLVLIASLLCAILPKGTIALFATVFSLLHMYELSVETALVGACLYLVISLLFLRFVPGDSLVVLITAVLFAWKIPYVMPIAMGLISGPAAAVSVGCGVVIYYFLAHVTSSATAISAMEEGEAAAKLRILVDGLIDNKTMLVMVAAFAVTVVVVYLLRRMSVDHAWSIAMVTGAIVNLMVLLIGDLIYDTNMSLGSAIIGVLVALVIAKVLEFFRFCVDYSRTEKVQFEDDEYYYYVKAVPKMSLAAPARTVKKINSQKRSMAVHSGYDRNSGRGATYDTNQEAAQDYYEEDGLDWIMDEEPQDYEEQYYGQQE